MLEHSYNEIRLRLDVTELKRDILCSKLKMIKIFGASHTKDPYQRIMPSYMYILFTHFRFLLLRCIIDR
jgi:hypothetical protein